MLYEYWIIKFKDDEQNHVARLTAPSHGYPWEIIASDEIFTEDEIIRIKKLDITLE